MFVWSNNEQHIGKLNSIKSEQGRTLFLTQTVTKAPVQKDRMRKSQVLDGMREDNEILENEQLMLMKRVIPLRKREEILRKCLESLEHCSSCTNAMTAARVFRGTYNTAQPAQSRPSHLSHEGKNDDDNAYTSAISFAYEPDSTLKTTRAVMWPKPVNSWTSSGYYPQSDVEVMNPEYPHFRFRGQMMDNIGPFEEHKNNVTWQSARSGNETRDQISNKGYMCATAAQPFTHVRIQQGHCSFLHDTATTESVPTPRDITMDAPTRNCRETHLLAHNGNYLKDANWVNASSDHSKGLACQISQTIKQEPLDDMECYTQPCVGYAKDKASSEEQQKQLHFHQGQQTSDKKSTEVKKITAWLEEKSDNCIFSISRQEKSTLNETLRDLELLPSNTNSYNFDHQALNQYIGSDIDVGGEPNTLKGTYYSPLPSNVPNKFTHILPVGHQHNFQTSEKQLILGAYTPVKQPYHNLNSISNRSPAVAPAPFGNPELTHRPIGVKIENDGSTDLKTSSFPHGLSKIPYKQEIQLDNIKREQDSSGIGSSAFEHTDPASRKQLYHELNRKPSRKSYVAPLPFSFKNSEFASTAVKIEEGDFADTKPVTGFQQDFLQTSYVQESQRDSVKREYTSSNTAEGNCESSSDLLSIELSELEEQQMD